MRVDGRVACFYLAICQALKRQLVVCSFDCSSLALSRVAKDLGSALEPCSFVELVQCRGPKPANSDSLFQCRGSDRCNVEPPFAH